MMAARRAPEDLADEPLARHPILANKRQTIALVVISLGVAVLYLSQLDRSPAYLSIEEVGATKRQSGWSVTQVLHITQMKQIKCSDVE